MIDEYNHNRRSKYLIKLHFVFAVKYRKRLLTESLNDDMLQIMSEIAKQKGFKIDTIQSDVDHLHVLVDISPSFSAFEMAHQLKQISTYRIYKKYRIELKKHFWKENTFWSDGYFVCSTGNASTETIRKYIETQG
ncbi:MAG: IS200/IS605 family transposase [Peptostreptococcaceae bacterium]|nr:IS200/IS605 family transposase [Peptostreptococcaceae bacterium]